MLPDQSCRKCGGELLKYTLCAECKKVTQWACKLCNLTTMETHAGCLYLETYLLVGKRNFGTLRTVHYPERNHLMKIRVHCFRSKKLLVFGLIAVMLITMSFTTVDAIASMFTQFESELIPPSIQSPTHMTPFSSIPMIDIHTTNQNPTHPVNDMETSYNDCIGAANGVFLTMECTAVHGSPYIVVAEIPYMLKSQFGSNVFSISGFSVTVKTNSLVINYDKKQYETQIIT